MALNDPSGIQVAHPNKEARPASKKPKGSTTLDLKHLILTKLKLPQQPKKIKIQNSTDTNLFKKLVDHTFVTQLTQFL
jgi:hypothetical protein